MIKYRVPNPSNIFRINGLGTMIYLEINITSY